MVNLTDEVEKEIEQEEVYLFGGDKVKIGEQFTFINPDAIDDRTSSNSTRYMIKTIGAGPFTLLGVRYYPRDREPLFMLRFKDSSGKTQRITSNYFCKVG